MEKMFCIGLLFGAVGGALLVANSYKVRSLVKKSQSEFMQKAETMIDERLKEQDGTAQESKEQSEKKKK